MPQSVGAAFFSLADILHFRILPPVCTAYFRSGCKICRAAVSYRYAVYYPPGAKQLPVFCRTDSDISDIQKSLGWEDGETEKKISREERRE